MSGGASAHVPEASAAELPRILAVPPWEGFEPPVLAGLAAPDPRTAWRDGEREEWLDGDPGAVAAPPEAGAETLARMVRDGHALTGLDVLAEIGTGAALAQLDGIARKSGFAGVQDAAGRKVREAACGLGLTPDQLADRLVPGFGLDAAGTLTLDYGARRFTVGFDEAPRPLVTDQDGAPRKALPKPGAKDDPALAPAAYEAFAELKKDVRDAAAGLLLRFEKAMVERRRWTSAYAILQPFPQLGRPVHALTAEERESGRLRRFENLKVPYEAVLALARRGWDRGRPQDGGVERWVSRFAARGRCVVVEPDPGIYAGDVTASADRQTLRHVWLGEKPALHRTRASNDEPPSFGELDPVTASEILADLTALTESAA
jgi:hypothetical protein